MKVRPYGITQLGTQVRLPDGREATVVYNSLAGVGVKLGLHNPPPEAFKDTNGNTVPTEMPPSFEWEPDLLLRSPGLTQVLGITCVCDEDEVQILRVGLS